MDDKKRYGPEWWAEIDEEMLVMGTLVKDYYDSYDGGYEINQEALDRFTKACKYFSKLAKEFEGEMKTEMTPKYLSGVIEITIDLLSFEADGMRNFIDCLSLLDDIEFSAKTNIKVAIVAEVKHVWVRVGDQEL
jgi:hypothetical protein